MDGPLTARIVAIIVGILSLWMGCIPLAFAGTLSGSTSAAPATVNLTSEGTADWVHWGRTTTAAVDRKAAVTPQISTYSTFGGATPFAEVSGGAGYSWTDGTPLGAASNDQRGVRVNPIVGGGFRFTVPADANLRTLKVYVGLNRVRAKLSARLSDNSAPALATLVELPTSRATRVVTLSFRANSAAQTLTVEVTLDAIFPATYHWIMLEAAALQVTSGTTSMPLPYSNSFSSATAAGWQVVNDAGTASDWAVRSGQYQQSRSMGTYGTALAGGYHRGTYAYLSAGTTLSDYRLSVDATSLSETAEDIGVMVRLNPGAGTYIRFSTSGAIGFARLETRNGTSFATLTKNARGHLTRAPANMALEVKGPVVVARLNGEKLFGAYEPGLTAGTVALYCRDACAFDNVSVQVNASAPTIVIAAPAGYSVAAGSPLPVRAVVLNRPAGATVTFKLDGSPCSPAVEQVSAVYFASACSAPGYGVYELAAELRSQSGALLDSHTSTGVGIGDNFVALGDSITYGSGDTTASDGRSSSGWVVSVQGYSARLTDLLNASQPRPSIVHRAGVPGDTTANMLNERLTSWLEQYQDSTKAIVLIGVNDANGALLTPSGLGCSDSACSGTFKGNLQTIVNRMKAAGKTAVVSRVPPRFGDALQAPYASPETNSRNLLIRDGYNQVIEQELTNRRLGPDLYDYFLGSENRFYLYASNLHPNALGHEVIAQLTHNSLTGSTSPPFIATALCLRRVRSGSCITPLPYKQNLMETGDPYYVDTAFKLTGSLPAAVANGRWIMTSNADRNLGNSDYLSFNVPAPSTIYVAYDAGAVSRPAWLRRDYTDSGLRITTTDPNAPSMKLYRRQNVTGNVVLGGAAASTNGADANLIAIVVQD